MHYQPYNVVTIDEMLRQRARLIAEQDEDTLEALSGPGENQGFSWTPTSEGEGLQFTFPKPLGKCGGTEWGKFKQRDLN